MVYYIVYCVLVYVYEYISNCKHLYKYIRTYTAVRHMYKHVKVGYKGASRAD